MNYAKSIFGVLENSLRHFSDNEAVYDGYQHVTYRELYKQAEDIAAGLAYNGVTAGEKVIVCMPNWYEYVVIYFALAKIGAILIPCDPCYQAKEWNTVFGLTSVKAVFCAGNNSHLALFAAEKKKGNIGQVITVRSSGADFPSFMDLLHTGEKNPLVSHAAENENKIFAILYTSGSTGHAKGVMLTHGNFIYSAQNTIRILHCNDSDHFLVPVPFSHVFGLIPGILSVIMAGGKMVLMERFHADKALQLIKKEQITVHFGVPTMFILELNDSAFNRMECSSLRTGIIAGSPCPEKLVNKIKSEMGCNIIVSYGATETSAGVTFTAITDSAWTCAKSVGTAVPGMQVKFVDQNRCEVAVGVIGELACRGKGIMKGYFQNEEKTNQVIDEAGWYYTEDLGYIDENGYVFIAGRKKDMIIRGGFNIHPREIEELFYGHPSVTAVSIVGLPDTVLGEVTCAAIQLNANHKKESPEMMKEFIKGKVSKWKVPDYILFTEEFPVTATGKIDKKTLREICQTALAKVLR